MSPRRTPYVVLLRGINVGANRKVPMKELKALLEAGGAEDVSTYVQSGNVVLRSNESAGALRDDLEKRLRTTFGFDVKVMIRTMPELEKIVTANPYGAETKDPTKVFVVFLAEKAKAADVAAIDAARFAPDTFAANGSEIYLHLPNGAGRSKLAGVVENKVKVPATIRNWRTVTNLLELAREL